MAEPTKAHILVLPYPAQGHLPPLINLAQSLANQGALITLINVHSIHNRLQDTWNSPPCANIRLRSLPFPYDIPYGYDASCHLDQSSFTGALRETQLVFEQLVENILSETKDEGISCLVADYLWGWHLESAKKYGIRGASYWPGSATWNSVHYHLPLMVSNGDAPIRDVHDNKVITYIPGVSPTNLAHIPYYIRGEYSSTTEYVIQEQNKLLKCMDEKCWVLINSVEEMEPEAFEAMKKVFGNRYIGIGPLFPICGNIPTGFHSLRPENHECLTWLNTQPPKSVLYISFGSVATLSDAQVLELAKGVFESKVPFLWVLNDKQNGAIVKDLKFTTGKIVTWAPQLKVLSHGSVGAFLSHCGWNSVFESISHGVPIIGWPCVVEQNLNCKTLVHDWKVGVELIEHSKYEIKNAIKEVQRNSEIRRNVELRKRNIRTACECGSSYNSLNLFLMDVLKT